MLKGSENNVKKTIFNKTGSECDYVTFNITKHYFLNSADTHF